MWIPIAAKDEAAIKTYVGNVADSIVSETGADKGRVNALLVQTRKNPNVPKIARMWKDRRVLKFSEILYPDYQVWVHVDYHSYRDAYEGFRKRKGVNLKSSAGLFLDHIQNRKAIRGRGLSHPYLRLCPVSSDVNTSGGCVTGGEGMEKAFIKYLGTKSTGAKAKLKTALRANFAEAIAYPIQYADPMDLTKMLNIAPGTQTLGGVAESQWLFYP